MKTPTTVWRISPELIAALDEKFGDPVDAYVNGSQTWLIENGPNETTLEWRLHPVSAYERPKGIDTYAVFRSAADGRTEPATLWDGLEAFPAYDDEMTVEQLRASVVEALGLEPDASGEVEHDAIGDEWESTSGRISIVDRLFDQLRSNTRE
ncbi:MAG TPA: hypothetical protein VM345_02630 [Acidimicrobiales bacterium]|jgi:hypothetical protein|nr:hypothetical protein [Acidimicrobiales bacterium]